LGRQKHRPARHQRKGALYTETVSESDGFSLISADRSFIQSSDLDKTLSVYRRLYQKPSRVEHGRTAIIFPGSFERSQLQMEVGIETQYPS